MKNVKIHFVSGTVLDIDDDDIVKILSNKNIMDEEVVTLRVSGLRNNNGITNIARVIQIDLGKVEYVEITDVEEYTK